MTKGKRSAELKRNRLKLHFEDRHETWSREAHLDDRRLFCNLYQSLLVSLDAMETMDNNTVWVAYNRYFNDQFAKLSDIDSRFDGYKQGGNE